MSLSPIGGDVTTLSTHRRRTPNLRRFLMLALDKPLRPGNGSAGELWGGGGVG